MNWSKISCLFLKIAGKNFVKIYFLVISVNFCWHDLFLTKVILVKLKFLYIFMQCPKWFVFWNIFLYCKVIISFLEFFSATCFLCILQIRSVFWYFFLFWIYLSLCMQVMMYNYSYYMYSHFLVHEDNKNARKIKLLVGSVKYKHWLTFSFKCEYEVREYITSISTFIFKKGKFYNF